MRKTVSKDYILKKGEWVKYHNLDNYVITDEPSNITQQNERNIILQNKLRTQSLTLKELQELLS